MPFDIHDPQLILALALLILFGLFAGALLTRIRAKAQLQSALHRQAEHLNAGFAVKCDQQLQQLAFVQQRLSEKDLIVVNMTDELQQLRQAQLSAEKQLGQLNQQVAQISQLQQEKQHWQQQYQHALEQVADLRTKLGSETARFEQEQIASQDKLVLLESAEKRLQEQFENLANKIFEQKNEKFGQSSKAGLDAMLSPLKEQIEGFKKQFTEQHIREGQERASLKTEILSLKALNQQITEDAAALTRALKGDNKQQGNWGEVVLERILRESGLREGHEFRTQVSLKNDAGKNFQPDVVVHLPNNKDVVVDSKVSLASYERYFNHSEDEKTRQTYLNEHVNSMRNHIKILGKKNYQDLNGIRTLDYVLMFVPIEPAFLLAVDQAPDLIKLALDNNIMLVSPTNLLVALRTINNIWQYEYQNQNAQKIADNAAKLYDKFHGFVVDMEKIGKGIESVQKSYDGAMNKLSSGKGNLVRQVEQFHSLGVQSNKKLDNKLLNIATEIDDE